MQYINLMDLNCNMIAIVMLANTSIVSPNEVRDVVQETGIKTIPMGKEMQESKMAVCRGLKNSCKKKRSESKGEKERYTI